jgi:hypothetical protein
VLVALLAVVLLVGQEYLVYTDDGLRLQVPFFQRDKVPEIGDVSVMVQSPASSAQSTPPQAPPEPLSLSALRLSVSDLVDGTAQDTLEREKANALILEMKAPSGKLSWQSYQPLAAVDGVNGPLVNQAIRQWNEGEWYTIAQVCCFRDNTLPYQRNNVALRASYGNWRDELGSRWLNPANEEAQNYLLGLIVELAELGFDEIVLDQYAFPLLGQTQLALKQPEQNDARVVEEFLEKVSQALGEYDAVLSLWAPRATLAGEEQVSGLSSALLEQYATHLWMRQTELGDDVDQLLTKAGITQPQQRLVREVSALTGAGQALLSADQGSSD